MDLESECCSYGAISALLQEVWGCQGFPQSQLQGDSSCYSNNGLDLKTEAELFFYLSDCGEIFSTKNTDNLTVMQAANVALNVH